MISLKLNLTLTASIVVLSTLMPLAGAQETAAPGMVRISDSRPRTTAHPASFRNPRFSGDQQVSESQGSGIEYQEQCDTGNCPDRRCRGHLCDGLFQEHYGTKSPDYGYSPPAKYPLHRRGVEYKSYYPQQWYGQPGGGLAGGYPMVYQPTDTTQLGFTYQHVPYWQPNPNMVPKRPVPAQWHIVAPPYNSPCDCYHGACRYGAMEYQIAPGSEITSPQGGSMNRTENSEETDVPLAPATILQEAPTPLNNAPEASRSQPQNRATGWSRLRRVVQTTGVVDVIIDAGF